ncbi:MlaD family protein [Ramlibacter albus]|uniref:MCE family protein n=1 Tax=Ramlibacter albus TaxID=2079448 RepID=A0A923M650_9BURK|nr:MlaD family protein [Ramlibacter albus]MBC5763481.1 MCE family protein [Ramlibacter albus]
MENKAHAMAAGIFVVLMTFLLLALASWLTRETGVRDTYEISTKESVTGLQEQAPVRYRGVDVGKVSRIGFDPKQQGNVLIRLQVEREAPMTKGTFATLSFQGVTGLAFVQLDDNGQQPTRLQPDEANPPRIPLRPGLLAKLEEKGEVIVDRVSEVAERVNRLLNDENQKKLTLALGNLGQAADSANQLASRLDATVQKRLDPALAEAVPAMKSVQRSADEIGRTAADFGATARRLNQKDGPIDRLAEGTQALSHAADSFNSATLPRLNRVTEDAGRAVRQLGRTASSISDNPQSLIFGTGKTEPGPGEPGFATPGGAR